MIESKNNFINSIGFPKMFSGSNMMVVDGNTATLSNMHLLLSTKANTMFGDPEIGINQKYFVFDQNNYVLADIIVDDVYTKICTFFPQVFLERKNINIYQEGNKLYARISCRNRDNFELNTFNIELITNAEE